MPACQLLRQALSKPILSANDKKSSTFHMISLGIVSNGVEDDDDWKEWLTPTSRLQCCGWEVTLREDSMVKSTSGQLDDPDHDDDSSFT